MASLHWTPEMLTVLREMRAAGLPFLLCAERIGVDYKTAVRKGRELGLHGRRNRGQTPGRYVREAADRRVPHQAAD